MEDDVIGIICSTIAPK